MTLFTISLFATFLVGVFSITLKDRETESWVKVLLSVLLTVGTFASGWLGFHEYKEKDDAKKEALKKSFQYTVDSINTKKFYDSQLLANQRQYDFINQSNTEAINQKNREIELLRIGGATSDILDQVKRKTGTIISNLSKFYDDAMDHSNSLLTQQASLFQQQKRLMFQLDDHITMKLHFNFTNRWTETIFRRYDSTLSSGWYDSHHINEYFPKFGSLSEFIKGLQIRIFFHDSSGLKSKLILENKVSPFFISQFDASHGPGDDLLSLPDPVYTSGEITAARSGDLFHFVCEVIDMRIISLSKDNLSILDLENSWATIEMKNRDFVYMNRTDSLYRWDKAAVGITLNFSGKIQTQGLSGVNEFDSDNLDPVLISCGIGKVKFN